MKNNQTGRTLVEMLAILCIIGIVSVSGSRLFSKAMNTIRANYIMEQVFVKANEQIEIPVGARHKTVDLAVSGKEGLSYGYEFAACTAEEEKGRCSCIKMLGIFPLTMCKILKKKIETQEYEGLITILANATDLKGTGPMSACPSDKEIRSMTFYVDPAFRRQ